MMRGTTELMIQDAVRTAHAELRRAARERELLSTEIGVTLSVMSVSVIPPGHVWIRSRQDSIAASPAALQFANPSRGCQRAGLVQQPSPPGSRTIGCR